MPNYRYIAVHNPVDYSQSNNDANATRKRFAKYLLPVIVVSILFNIPKFLEAKIKMLKEGDVGYNNVTTAAIDVTDLRIHPTYAIYTNWSQSLVLGFIPAAFLVYFNTKIYLDVR